MNNVSHRVEVFESEEHGVQHWLQDLCRYLSSRYCADVTQRETQRLIDHADVLAMLSFDLECVQHCSYQLCSGMVGRR